MFCSIDENGLVFDENKKRITERDVLEEFFAELKVLESFQVVSVLHGQPVIVEAFDAPLVAHKMNLSPSKNSFMTAEGFEWNFELSTLIMDEWDRFHGVSANGVPFVMTSAAQNSFFDQVDEFDDESITYLGKVHTLESFWPDAVDVEQESFWTEKYHNAETGWDLGEPASALKSLLPKLKLPASKVLVLGGGGGHDAALFAEQGHHVTLVDISPEAIARAQTKYGHHINLSFLQMDLFDLPVELYGQFDLVFEHTCYCAINPTLRNELVKQWRRLLTETGFLLGVFFTMPKRTGPPFGGSEWELRRRLQKGFQPMVWQRFRQSIKPRLGRELLIYARKNV